jgi:quercetin dioxygenase-like cupin family protein
MLVVAAIALLVTGILVGRVIGQAGDAPSAVRLPLAESTKVKGASGKTLGLSKVTIPVGGRIALHHHEGTQAAFIKSGSLTYTVKSGSVAVMEGPADEATVVRKIEGGQTGRITAGQWIIEQPSTIHRAANKGSSKVVIFLATLLRSGAPPSTPND